MLLGNAVGTFLWGAFLSGCALATPLNGRGACPLTLVGTYKDGGCNARGWVQLPNYLQHLTGVKTNLECAAKCRADEQCKSFRFRHEAQKCDLYRRYLSSMEFTAQNQQIGRYSNRDCYSSDCDTIKACKAIDMCVDQCTDRGYCERTYSAYACGYGVTTNLGKRGNATQMLFDGSLDTCQAVFRCARQYVNGPFDLFYQSSSQQWVCILRDVFTRGYAYYDLDTTDQGINRHTLSVKNKTVGASYGYYFSDYYES